MSISILTALAGLALAVAQTPASAPAPAPKPAAKPTPAGSLDPRAAEPGKLPLPTVIEKIQKNYDQAKDFKARFAQKYTSAAFGRTKVSTGQITFKKPGRMRWDYDPPEAKMFLSTGQVLWMYEPEDKQAYRQDLKQSQLPAALSFLLGKGRLSDEFEIVPAGEVPYGTGGDYRLSLKPKQPQATYKSIYFIVDPKTFFVIQSVLVNAQGDVNDITFSDLKVNSKIADALFKWSPPAGTRVVDTAAVKK
jgi:outer membrane lipoprotein carrier protein